MAIAPQKHIYYVRASALGGLTDFANASGLNVENLLQDAGLSRTALDDPEQLVTYEALCRILDLGAERSGDSLFGLRLGLQQDISRTLGPLLYLTRNCETIRQALEELIGFYRFHTNAVRVRLEVHGSSVVLASALADREGGAGLRQVIDLIAGGSMQLMRILLGDRWQPKALMHPCGPAATAQDYRRLLGLVPDFNAEQSGWLFEAGLLDIPLESADRELHRLIQKQLVMLESLPEEDFPTNVRRIITQMLPQGAVSIERVSACLSLSPRTLQRHLGESDTSFQELLDDSRRAMAGRYLNDATLPLSQLAELVGYSELSSFSRAFKRWFGVSPKEWKKRRGRSDRVPTKEVDRF